MAVLDRTIRRMLTNSRNSSIWVDLEKPFLLLLVVRQCYLVNFVRNLELLNNHVGLPSVGGTGSIKRDPFVKYHAEFCTRSCVPKRRVVVNKGLSAIMGEALMRALSQTGIHGNVRCRRL